MKLQALLGYWAGTANEAALTLAPKRLADEICPETGLVVWTQTLYARALANARGGNPAAAEPDVQELAKVVAALKDNYWMTETEVQRLTTQGWVEFAKGNRGAADMEDANEQPSPHPGAHAARARTLRRHAARRRPSRGGAGRVREIAAARAEPLSAPVRRGPGGGAGGQPRQGAPVLLEARRDGRAGRARPRAASGQAVPGEKLNQAQGDRRLDRRQVRRLSDTEIRLLHARVRRERRGTIWASDIGGQTKTSRQTKTPREPDLARRGSQISKPPTEEAQNRKAALHTPVAPSTGFGRAPRISSSMVLRRRARSSSRIGDDVLCGGHRLGRAGFAALQDAPYDSDVFNP